MQEKEGVKILITGDFCPINRIEEKALKGSYDTVFNDYLDVLSGNDLNIVDLECPITNSKKERAKTGPYQKAHPETIELLKHANINLVTLSNNHIMDYDSDGALETISTCRNNNIEVLGIGKTKKEAASVFSFEKEGTRIGILNYADNEFLTASDNSLYCNSIDTIRCYYEIKEARKNHDFVICIIHAGNEFYRLPSPRTKELYRFIADSGADAIISHHTHVYSGYEIYNKTPIFYGLGNFVYDWPGKVNSDWNFGYVVKLVIGSKINFEIIPLTQCNKAPGVFRLSASEEDQFNNNIAELNSIILDDKKLQLEFEKYCESVFPMYDAFMEPYFGRLITALQKRKLLPKFSSKQKRLFHLNLTRCESHRDVVIRMLKRYE